ncbi:hypothetical protein QP028_11400 [Corynebacterium suedekumii]|nr:hypothetical protein QP028_11400 [Corynebacterium suedekumii]
MAEQLVIDRPNAPTVSTRTSRSSGGRGGNAATTAILVVALIFFFLPWIAAAVFGFTRPGEGITAAPLLESLQNPKRCPPSGTPCCSHWPPRCSCSLCSCPPTSSSTCGHRSWPRSPRCSPSCRWSSPPWRWSPA